MTNQIFSWQFHNGIKENQECVCYLLVLNEISSMQLAEVSILK